MKWLHKIFLSFLLFITLVGMTSAQKALGLYVGSVTNKFEGDRVTRLFEVGFRVHSSASAGLVFDLPIKPDVYITFIPGYKNISGTIYEANEAYDEQIDAGIEVPTVPKTVDLSTMNLNYLALPVLLKIISDNEHWQFMAGLEPAWNFKASLKDLNTGEKEDVKHYVRDINLSAIFGFGYRFKIKNTRWAFDLMYTQGLLNMSHGQKVLEGVVPRVKSTTAETRLTWYFISQNKKRK
ncbi:outer membrane beta-barrel protein [Reichenbachiella sp.]|uniref:outer membrane beta-barrel protein n=1 Tax=Reichenbachiella sp. TaxID=2184521 RepID=UPI003BB001A4